MNPKFSLLPEHLGDSNVITFPSFVGTTSFLVRRNRLENGNTYLSSEQLKTAGFEFDPVTGDYGDDSTVMSFFRDNTEIPRMQFFRTPLFISDEYGDGVLFVSSTGDHAIFDRKVVDAAGLSTIYRLNSPEMAPSTDVGDNGAPENAAMFTDVAEGPGDLIIVCCEVKLPALPLVRAWMPVAPPPPPVTQMPQAPQSSSDQIIGKSDASDKGPDQQPGVIPGQSFGSSQPGPASTHVPPSNQPVHHNPYNQLKAPTFIPAGATVVSGQASSAAPNTAPVVPVQTNTKP